jgi:hypothetical protein
VSQLEQVYIRGSMVSRVNAHSHAHTSLVPPYSAPGGIDISLAGVDLSSNILSPAKYPGLDSGARRTSLTSQIRFIIVPDLLANAPM